VISENAPSIISGQNYRHEPREPTQRTSFLLGESALITAAPLFFQESQHVMPMASGSLQHGCPQLPLVWRRFLPTGLLFHEIAIASLAKSVEAASTVGHLIEVAAHGAPTAVVNGMAVLGFVPVGFDVYACCMDMMPHTLAQSLAHMG